MNCWLRINEIRSDQVLIELVKGDSCHPLHILRNPRDALQRGRTPAFWSAVAACPAEARRRRERSGDTAPAREDLRSWAERSDGAFSNGPSLSSGFLCNIDPRTPLSGSAASRSKEQQLSSPTRGLLLVGTGPQVVPVSQRPCRRPVLCRFVPGPLVRKSSNEQIRL